MVIWREEVRRVLGLVVKSHRSRPARRYKLSDIMPCMREWAEQRMKILPEVEQAEGFDRMSHHHQGDYIAREFAQLLADRNFG